LCRKAWLARQPEAQQISQRDHLCFSAEGAALNFEPGANAPRGFVELPSASAESAIHHSTSLIDSADSNALSVLVDEAIRIPWACPKLKVTSRL